MKALPFVSRLANKFFETVFILNKGGMPRSISDCYFGILQRVIGIGGQKREDKTWY